MKLGVWLFLLIIVLVFTYDIYSYGIALKHTPLLVTNPLLVIQLHNLATGTSIPIAACPEISKFRKGSIYNDYSEIPLSEWNRCIGAAAPSSIIVEPCLEAERGADDLLWRVNAKNELLLGLEKYGVRFSAESTYRQLVNYADSNLCTLQVADYAAAKGIDLNFRPSSLLNAEKFESSPLELDEAKLLEIASTEYRAESFLTDSRLSSLILICGIFVFLLLIYSVFSNMRGNERLED
ncbi:MAG: hypothetical protein ABIG96_01785 [Candidatus Micrarchaeota archaeon]